MNWTQIFREILNCYALSIFRVFILLASSDTKVLTICGKRCSNRIPNDIVISVNGSQLEDIQCAKLLGLEIDKELTFHSHVDKLCKKLSHRIGILRKIRHLSAK